MSKLAIVTRSDNSVKAMTDLTHPIIRGYADKCRADFIQLDNVKPPVITDDNHPHWRIVEVYNLYKHYDRILVLDSDVVLTKHCTNIFDEVSEDSIGTIFEDKGTRKPYRRDSIRHIQKQFGDIGWKEGYINTGVFLTSKQHKDVFLSIDGKYYTAMGSDDVHIGYQINKLGYKIHELDFTWNHMTMFSEPWNNKADRYKSKIIHYAGRGQFNPRISRLENIRQDIEHAYQD